MLVWQRSGVGYCGEYRGNNFTQRIVFLWDVNKITRRDGVKEFIAGLRCGSKFSRFSQYKGVLWSQIIHT